MCKENSCFKMNILAVLRKSLKQFCHFVLREYIKIIKVKLQPLVSQPCLQKLTKKNCHHYHENSGDEIFPTKEGKF